MIELSKKEHPYYEHAKDFYRKLKQVTYNAEAIMMIAEEFMRLQAKLAGAELHIRLLETERDDLRAAHEKKR